jgi:peroxiredoxin
MTLIQPGSAAPAFALDSHSGDRVESAKFAGEKNLLLVFYPLDFTPT